jgi:hypothetical protein
LCDRFTVRDCSLYPRFSGRCKPWSLVTEEYVSAHIYTNIYTD